MGFTHGNPHASPWRRFLASLFFLVMLTGSFFVSAEVSHAQEPPAAEVPMSAAAAVEDDLATTMTLNLKNMPIEQLLKFLSDTTGKAVIPQKGLSAQISVSSPTPVTKRRALDLIFDALRLEGIFVIETDDRLQIVKADAIKNLSVRTVPDEVDIQTLPNSFELIQKIYKLKNISAENIKVHLSKFIPESSITLDSESNTLILTDQLVRLKSYDTIVKSLDAFDTSDTVVEIFKLEHAGAQELAQLLVNVLKPANGPGGPSPPGPSSRRKRSVVEPVTIGNITLVPDARMNWLIVVCPSEDLEKIRGLIKEFDQPQPPDVKTRVIEVNYMDASGLSEVVGQLFRDERRRGEKDRVNVVPSEDGNRLLVLSSEENFKRVVELVGLLDTEDAEKRETKSYKVKHLEAKDLAEQLKELFREKTGTSSYYDWYGGGRQQRGIYETDANFVPSPRTNTLVIMARPRDMPFIFEMIAELDVPIDAESFEPRIYRIRHTDATEVVRVLEALFEDDASASRENVPYWWRRGQQKEKDSLKAMFGQIRFVVDTITNTIVAFSSNPENYKVVDRLVAKLDKVDPESTRMLIRELRYADAHDVADHLNALFSEGPIQQAQQQQQQDDEDDEDDTRRIAETIRNVIYPWQAGRDRRDDEEERPINTMIGFVRVVPDARTNTVMVAAPSIYFDSLNQLLDILDKPEPQVNITTRIIEIQRGKERRIGLRWTPDPNSIDPAELDNAILGLSNLGFLESFGPGSRSPTDVISTREAGEVIRTAETTTRAGNVVLGANINLALLVQLLLKNTNSRVVSEPFLALNNNEQGRLVVGSEIAFEAGNQTDTAGQTTQIQYRPVGLTLLVKPTINVDNQVMLQMILENSRVREGVIINDQIVTDNTEFETQLAIDDGETMVIGGILIDTEVDIKRRPPVLGRIPGLRWLFGTKEDSSEQVRELIVFMTPEVLLGPAERQELFERYEDRFEEEM